MLVVPRAGRDLLLVQSRGMYSGRSTQALRHFSDRPDSRNTQASNPHHVCREVETKRTAAPVHSPFGCAVTGPGVLGAHLLRGCVDIDYTYLSTVRSTKYLGRYQNEVPSVRHVPRIRYGRRK